MALTLNTTKSVCACGHVLLLLSFASLRVRRFLWLSLGLQSKAARETERH